MASMKLLGCLLLVTLSVISATSEPRERCIDRLNRLKKLKDNSPHPLVGMELPVCDEYGDYVPKQCQGSMCFCMTRQGVQTGHAANKGQAAEMNCKCATLTYTLKQYGYDDGTKCAPNGNYEKVQCLTTNCICVDPLTGLMVSGKDPVPKSKKDSLQC